MGKCSAPNCSLGYEDGVRTFRFPTNEERKRKWVQFMRRSNENWTPNKNSRLCDMHFEASQYETGRQDGWLKLKQDAVPTIFPVPNKPKLMDVKRKSKFKRQNTENMPQDDPLHFMAKKLSSNHSQKTSNNFFDIYVRSHSDLVSPLSLNPVLSAPDFAPSIPNTAPSAPNIASSAPNIAPSMRQNAASSARSKAASSVPNAAPSAPSNAALSAPSNAALSARLIAVPLAPNTAPSARLNSASSAPSKAASSVPNAAPSAPSNAALSARLIAVPLAPNTAPSARLNSASSAPSKAASSVPNAAPSAPSNATLSARLIAVPLAPNTAPSARLNSASSARSKAVSSVSNAVPSAQSNAALPARLIAVPSTRLNAAPRAAPSARSNTVSSVPNAALSAPNTAPSAQMNTASIAPNVVPSARQNAVSTAPKEAPSARLNAASTAPNPESAVRNKIKKRKLEFDFFISDDLLTQSVCPCGCAEEIKRLKEENDKLKAENQKKLDAMQKFLTEDQINVILSPAKKVREWSANSIIQGFKFRFGLSVHGYQYLRQTGYPLPGYSTLTKRMQSFQLDFGLFKDIQTPLQHKIQSMESRDRFCFLSIDEMEINKQLSYDKNRTQMFGYITLGQGKGEVLGSKLLVAVIRGVKYNWKQIVAAHITNGSVNAADMKKFIEECIDFCDTAGLKVVALGSDMGHENRGLWTCLDVGIQKIGVRRNMFIYKDRPIFVVPDVCHILKNLKNCMLTHTITLPADYCDAEKLPSREVKGDYLRQLWIIENPEEDVDTVPSDVTNDHDDTDENDIDDEDISDEDIDSNGHKDWRGLYHLKKIDLWPDGYKKMNVGSAERFFSLKSSGAIKLAVELKILPEEALTTAHFIDLIHDWFELTASKVRKTGVTKRNAEKKYDFLEKIVNISEETSFGPGGWKPLNVGLIMSALSLIDLSQLLINHGYDFVLLHRFTQDAIENIFSQIRRKLGKSPNAKECLQALKSISLAQFISDVQRSSYFNDNDLFLVDFFKKHSSLSNIPEVPITTVPYIVPSDNEKFSTEDILKSPGNLSPYDLNFIFFVAGSTTNAVLKLKCCEECTTFLKESLPADTLKQYKFYTRSLNKGGLHFANLAVFNIVFNCELLYKKYKKYILHNSAKSIIKKICDDVCIDFFTCKYGCDLKFKIVKHFFTVRSYAVTNTTCSMNKRSLNTLGTASAKNNK